MSRQSIIVAGSLLILLIAWVIMAIYFLSRPTGPRDWARCVEAFDRAFVEVFHGR